MYDVMSKLLYERCITILLDHCLVIKKIYLKLYMSYFMRNVMSHRKNYENKCFTKNIGDCINFT